jgi:hypothetical protein
LSILNLFLVALDVSFPNFEGLHPVLELILEHVGRYLSSLGYLPELFLLLVLQILDSRVKLDGLIVNLLFVLDQLGERHGSENAVGAAVCHLAALGHASVLYVYQRDAAEVRRGKAVLPNVLSLRWRFIFDVRPCVHGQLFIRDKSGRLRFVRLPRLWILILDQLRAVHPDALRFIHSLQGGFTFLDLLFIEQNDVLVFAVDFLFDGLFQILGIVNTYCQQRLRIRISQIGLHL